MRNLERIIAGVCAVILVIVVAQAVIPGKYVSQPPPPPPPQADCIGTPITVDQPYLGAALDPWTCQVQCNDDQPRYILYSNGMATQCETPPGCLDYGEDHGITCKPPVAQSTK
ncbi:MAG TPA: hypothetical protein VHA78_02085 [Candidatus Peribacteraceae bacterium]|nr:hypothetical protein [Candidatus Peribacteraceae bacterium]